MAMEQGVGSSEHSQAHANSTVNEVDPLAPATKKLGSQTSSCSSVSSSSSGDIFQVPADLPPIKTKVEEDVLFELVDENDTGFLGSASPSQVSDLRQELEPPPVQSMERSGMYKIPSYVFSRSQSGTPLEWSAASNDSLFSIHVGNNSFSRERIFMLDADNAKSGELTKSGELIVFTSTPPSQLEENVSKSVCVEKHSEMTAEANEPIKDDAPASASPASADRNDKKIAQPEEPSKSSSNRNADANTTSADPSALPKKKRSWTSCHCSNFSWAFCHCWNCSRFCCFPSTTSNEEEKNVSTEEQPEKQLSETQPEATAAEATPTGTATCCACFPHKCC